MIITRTPLRISLGGGGTDVPAYYRKAGGGFLIAAAISKYVYIAVNHNFDDQIMLKYSKIERVSRAVEAEHRLLREILTHTGIDRGLELSSMADIPAGTGLGSSGAFTVGVLNALRAYKHEPISPTDLATEACHIEIDLLGEPIGKQDQYIAAIGGITAFEFRDDEQVEIIPLEVSTTTRHCLEDNLLLFFTGVRRSASEVLAVEQMTNSAGATLDDNLDRVKAIGLETRDALLRGDLPAFGDLLTQQWRLKHERSPSDVHGRVDDWIRAGIEAGALGGKLVGAGGGGFLLFYAEEKPSLRRVMAEIGLEEVRFAIDYQGSTVVATA